MDGRTLVEIDLRYFRLTEVDVLIGHAGKAKEKLVWKATTTVRDLVREMTQADLHLISAPKGG